MRAIVLGVALLATTAVNAEVPVSLGVNAGVASGAEPWRSAPAVALSAGVGLPNLPVAITARVDGWTLGLPGALAANSETTGSIGAAYEREILPYLNLSAGAGAALMFRSSPGSALATYPGVMITPALEVSTRRRSLGLQLGGTLLFSTGGTRLGATAGVVYTFR